MEIQAVRVALWLLLQLPTERPDITAQVLDFLKVAAPAILAYLASRMVARKEQHRAQLSMEVQTRQQLASQQEGIIKEYQTMTSQAREVVTRAYAEAAEAAVARRVAENRAASLETELADLRRKYDGAMQELEELRTRRRRPRSEE